MRLSNIDCLDSFSAPTQIIVRGRLLEDLSEGGQHGLRGYLHTGGFSTLSQVVASGAENALSCLAASGLRGRAGGGFPIALKWEQVRKNNACSKFFVCNANAGQPGGGKESILIGLNPYAVVEAVALAASIVGAKVAFIFLGRSLEREQRLLEDVLRKTGPRLCNVISGLSLEIRIHRSEAGYLAGEETALLELLEGAPAKPRGKPALPTSSGFQKQPTAINNLETVMQALFAIRYGAERFRQAGTEFASGTVIFSVVGEVKRPGLYEVPLGIPLGALIHDLAGGMAGDDAFKSALVGGTSGTALTSAHLAMPLDYDCLSGVGGSLGGGVIIVLSTASSMVNVARDLAKFYHENSCGKCSPCKDGTRRAWHMLANLDRIGENATDWNPPEATHLGKRIPILLADSAPAERASISYTDSAVGLDKIRLMCAWYSTRGDCHHPAESSRMLQSLLDGFTEEFEKEIRPPSAVNESLP